MIGFSTICAAGGVRESVKSGESVKSEEALEVAP